MTETGARNRDGGGDRLIRMPVLDLGLFDPGPGKR